MIYVDIVARYHRAIYFLSFITFSLHFLALNSLICADVPLRNCSLLTTEPLLAGSEYWAFGLLPVNLKYVFPVTSFACADWLRTQDCMWMRTLIFDQNPWTDADSEFQHPLICDARVYLAAFSTIRDWHNGSCSQTTVVSCVIVCNKFQIRMVLTPQVWTSSASLQHLACTQFWRSWLNWK